MAWNHHDKYKSYEALQDFSADNFQYRIVELGTSRPNTIDYAAGGGGTGILMGNPRLGEAASVCFDGEIRCRAGSAIAIGQFITAAASGAGGPGWATAITSGMTGPISMLGQAKSAAASGSLFTIDMNRRQIIFPNSAGIIGDVTF